MSGRRLVLHYVGAMAALVLLWIWPATGLILMLASVASGYAMFLIGAVFNAMLLHVAYRALRGRIARRWLVLPALVYGGFALYATAGYLRARGLRHDLESAAAVDYARVPATHPTLLLVSGDNAPDVSRAMAFALAEIGADADIYTADQRWRLVPRRGAECPVPPGDGAHVDGAFLVRKRINAGYGTPPRCVIAEDAVPPTAAVRLRLTPPRPAPMGDDARVFAGFFYLHTDGLRLAAPRLADRYDVSAAGQAIGHAESGRVAHPFPIPLPYFGCLMNTLAGWTCHLGLATLSTRYGERDGPDEYARKAAYLTAVLGLKRARP